MDRISRFMAFTPVIMEKVVFGKKDSVPIDQQPCKDFNIDPSTGRPMSDITAVIRAQGLDKQRLLADMVEYKADFLPDDISDVDALKYAIPRLTQLPSELAEFQAALAEQKLKDEQENERQKKIDELLKSSDKDLFDKDKDVDKDKEE